MIVRKNNNAIEISFQYDPALISFVKSLENRKYNPSTKCWYLPLAGSHASIERLAERGFVIEPELLAAMKQDQEQAREAEALAVLENVKIDIDLPLYNFQKVCTAFMVKTGSCLNACGVGTGKSLMAIAATIINGTKKNLIVAPKSLLLQWEQQIFQWAPEYKTFVVSGNLKERKEVYDKAAHCEDAYFLIISYEQARIDRDILTML